MQESCQKELAQLDKTVEKRQKELDRLLPRYTRQKTEEERLNTRLKVCEQRRSELFAKQGRGQQFGSVAERDRWIRREAQSMAESLENKRRQMSQLRQDVEQSKAKVKQQEQDIKVGFTLILWWVCIGEWCVCVCVTGAWCGPGAEEGGD